MEANNFFDTDNQQLDQAANMLENMAFTKTKMKNSQMDKESPKPRGRNRFDSFYDASRATKNN